MTYSFGTGTSTNNRLPGGGFFRFDTSTGKPNYETLGGQKFDNESAYYRAAIGEKQANPKLYDDAQSLNSFWSGNSDFDRLFDKQFQNTKSLMDLTNQYRTKEGATQGQMDEQAFRRLSSQLETQKYMQVKGADLQERQRQYDSNRAITAFKGKF